MGPGATLLPSPPFENPGGPCKSTPSPEPNADAPRRDEGASGGAARRALGARGGPPGTLFPSRGDMLTRHLFLVGLFSVFVGCATAPAPRPHPPPASARTAPGLVAPAAAASDVPAP